MPENKISLVDSPKPPEPEANRRKDGRGADAPTIGGQIELLLGMVPGLLEEVEYSDEDIEDRGDGFEYEGDNLNAIAALEAVLDLPEVPAHLAHLPVECPRLDWEYLRCRVKSIGDLVEAFQEAIGDREDGEFGEALAEAMCWFHGF